MNMPEIGNFFLPPNACKSCCRAAFESILVSDDNMENK